MGIKIEVPQETYIIIWVVWRLHETPSNYITGYNNLA